MIAQVELHYDSRAKLVALCQEGHYQELKRLLTVIPEEEVAKDHAQNYMWQMEQLLDISTDGVILTEKFGIQFTVKKFKGTLPLTALLPDGNHYTVQVQVPHIGLLMLDEVEVFENACTEALQYKLDQGWRILCVCPPNAQRRPDYILGRTKGKDF